MKIRLLFVLSLLSYLNAQWQPLTYKPLTNKSVTLNFVRAINERFPKMDEEQIAIYLNEASKVVQEHFGITLKFQRQKNITVETLFKPFSTKIKSYLDPNICKFRGSTPHKKRLVSDLNKALENYKKDLPLEEMISYAKPYLRVKIKEKSTHGLSKALIETELYRLRQWLKIKAKDGKPVIDANPFNEWSYWDSLGYFYDDFDIILTNQLIASAEYYGQDMHSALRGGIVAGTTSYRKKSSYDAFVFMTSFIFINDDAMINTLRGSKNYTKEEAARYAGAYLAHEIGHMLLRLGHPFGNKHCVMAPSQMLYFDQWYHNIDASKCMLGSEKSMVPGSATLYYDDALLE